MNASTFSSQGVTFSPSFDELDHGVEHAADRGDEIANVVGEIPVIDREHADIVADDDEAREVHRADIVQSGVDRILVLCDRQRGFRSSDRGLDLERHDQIHHALDIVAVLERRVGTTGQRLHRRPSRPVRHQDP